MPKNKSRKVTSKQVAELAGVSQTTVSFVMNNVDSANISEETRHRVLQAAQTLHYIPDRAAQSLALGRSHNLGLVLIQPHYQVFRDPFIPNIITGMSQIVQSNGFRLLVEHIHDLDNISIISNMLKGGEVAGIVANTFLGIETAISAVIDEGYPIVLLDAVNEYHYAALIDHRAGVQLAAAHLVALGHTQIGCITFAPLNYHINRRLNAFKEILAAAGIALPSAHIREGNYDPESGYEAMHDLLQTQPHLTAIFGMNDMMAIGAMRAIHEAGLRIPDDVAVVGYDDMRFAAFTNPTLTTVQAPEVQVGQRAAEMLIALIQGVPLGEKCVKLPPQLVVRQSCGAAH